MLPKPQDKKAERFYISDKTFGNMPFTDLTSNQFIDGMKKIFALERFIKIHLMNVNREEEKFTQESAVASL